MDTTVAEVPGPRVAAKEVARVAITTADRIAAFRLRYEVYIAEQGKPYPEADHVERLLSDELDPVAALIIVESAGEIVGTVRANWFDSPATRARYGHVFELVRFPTIDPAEISVCSRLAASMHHRQAHARELLFATIYDRGLVRDGHFTHLCFATCAPILLRMFRKYGFREYIEPIRDPVVGTLHRTVLVVDDIVHFERVGSPFLRLAKERDLKPQERPWLQNQINDYQARHAVAK